MAISNRMMNEVGKVYFISQIKDGEGGFDESLFVKIERLPVRFYYRKKVWFMETGVFVEEERETEGLDSPMIICSPKFELSKGDVFERANGDRYTISQVSVVRGPKKPHHVEAKLTEIREEST